MFAEVNGIKMYYEIHGAGKPLILLTGFTAHSQRWTFQLNEFSKYFKVITLDNRNSGRSSIKSDTSIKDMADDVVQLMDYLNIEKAYFLGRSMGGYIVQEVAINYPKRVEKLVVQCSAPVHSARNVVLMDYLGEMRTEEKPSRNLIREFIFLETLNLQ